MNTVEMYSDKFNVNNNRITSVISIAGASELLYPVIQHSAARSKGTVNIINILATIEILLKPFLFYVYLLFIVSI